jgi:hypothetical protein
MTMPDGLKDERMAIRSGRRAERVSMATRMKALLVFASGAALAGLLLWPAHAAQPRVPGTEIFAGADLGLGEKLIEEHACEECHARNAGGNGTGIYRPLGRINTPGALRGMVEYCNTQLNLGMFPEEVTAVAAVLQRDFYRFH